MTTIELDGRSVENPAYCNHRRGRNWGAIVRGKNAANCERSFLRAVGEVSTSNPYSPVTCSNSAAITFPEAADGNQIADGGTSRTSPTTR